MLYPLSYARKDFVLFRFTSNYIRVRPYCQPGQVGASITRSASSSIASTASCGNSQGKLAQEGKCLGESGGDAAPPGPTPYGAALTRSAMAAVPPARDHPANLRPSCEVLYWSWTLTVSLMLVVKVCAPWPCVTVPLMTTLCTSSVPLSML
jgi:hypothetical protein